MKFLRGGLMAGVSLASLVALSPFAWAATSAGDPDGSPALLTELTFNTSIPLATTPSTVAAEISAPNWTFWAGGGGSLGVQPTTAPEGGGTVEALQGNYPAPATNGGDYVGAVYNIPAQYTDLEDVYIEFWAKMPGVKEGCKFMKVFGQRSATGGYADTTIFTDYTGAQYGAVRQIGFGDGTGLVNDSQNVITLTGLNASTIGRSAGTAVVNLPQASTFSNWGTGWHHFRMHVKFNDGTTSQNEVPDGEYYLEIDGKVYVDATGLFNRNPANGPIQKIEFFGWAQTEPQPFQVWYDDIRISTGGFMSSVMPNPPNRVGVK